MVMDPSNRETSCQGRLLNTCLEATQPRILGPTVKAEKRRGVAGGGGSAQYGFHQRCLSPSFLAPDRFLPPFRRDNWGKYSVPLSPDFGGGARPPRSRIPPSLYLNHRPPPECRAARRLQYLADGMESLARVCSCSCISLPKKGLEGC